MLDPVDLSVLPSCFGALAWSPDGELAVAANDHIYILTPNIETVASPAQSNEPWNITRFRVSSFIFAEWAAVYPQNRDNFSLAAEQSNSTILGLAWSPPGLAKFRRSVLAVLTSNLILSLWEPTGPNSQWTRVGIVNHALYPDPSTPAQQTGHAFRQVNIRSFEWCLPLKAPSVSKPSSSMHDFECRWGVYLLTVATDANEILLLRVKRSESVDAVPTPYCIEKLALQALEPEEGHFPAVRSGSLLQERLQSQARIMSLAHGPWLAHSNGEKGNLHSVTAMIAIIYGTRLHFVRINVGLRHSNANGDSASGYEITSDIGKHKVMDCSSKWAHRHFKAPLKWFYTKKSNSIALAACINGGIFTFAIQRSAYDEKKVKDSSVQTRVLHLSEPPTGVDEPLKSHWDPVTAMTESRDEQSDTCLLHLGTVGGVGAAISLHELENDVFHLLPSWTKYVEERREQYDLNLDLGGSSIARIWGMASYGGVNAILFTNHPTEMIEYRVSTDERCTIIFDADNTEHWNAANMQMLFAQQSGRPSRSVQEYREAVTAYLLFGNEEDGNEDDGEQRLKYAAACCAIVDGHQKSICSQAQQKFERLETLTGASLTEEISKCKTKNPSIPAKSTDQLNGPGGHMFEKCGICDTGIAWFAATEAQCTNGHLFARCGLTFLAIQEPGISKFCSVCRTEYLDEDLLAHKRRGQLSKGFQKLCEMFDTCVYCGGKFQSQV